MPACLIVDTAIENADEYEKYKTLQAHCRKYGDVYRLYSDTMEVLKTNLWAPTCIEGIQRETHFY
jgi:hypothetical protein